MAHPSDRHRYLDASKLIDGIDPKNIRSVIDAFQAVPNQREKSVYLSMLLARWAVLALASGPSKSARNGCRWMR